MRALFTACVAMTIAVMPTGAQAPGPMSPEQLRARLAAFAGDSLLGRKAGTPAHAKATQYIVNQLDALRGAGLSPMGDSAKWTQSVPLVTVQLDSTRTRLTGIKEQSSPIAYSVDFAPMLGILGFPSALPDSLRVTAIVSGGQLGSPTAVKPDAVRGKIVLFLPPRRPSGQPDYQLWSYTDLLATYKKSAAVIVESLDLTPRSLMARIKGPWLELPNQPNPEVPLPPVIAVSHAAAFLLADEHLPNRKVPGRASFAFSMRREATEVPAHNILAMLPGSDATLSQEVVVLSAHSDHLGVADALQRTSDDSIFNGADASGTGSVALLAIAEALAASPLKPQRSIVFLWTVGGERGELGSRWFSQHPTFKLDRIVAHIDVDMIGNGQTVATSVACPRSARRLGGSQSAEVFFTSVSNATGGGLYDECLACSALSRSATHSPSEPPTGAAPPPMVHPGAPAR